MAQIMVNRKQRFEDLEDEICGLLHQARMTLSHIEGVVNFELSLGHIGRNEADTVMFGLYETKQRAEDLRAKFYEAFDA